MSPEMLLGGLLAVMLGSLAWLKNRTPTPAPIETAPPPAEENPMVNSTLATVALVAKKYRIPEQRAQAAYQLALEQAAETGLDLALLLAMWHKESTLNPAAVNPKDPSYGLGAVQLFWIDGRIGITGTKADLMDPAFNARVSAHVIKYFRGETLLPDVRPNSNGERLYPYRYFAFPEECDVYNVGEPKFRNGTRNPAYRNAVRQYFTDWARTR